MFRFPHPTLCQKAFATLLAVAAVATAATPARAQDIAVKPDTALTATINDYANNTSGNGNLYGVMQASDGNFYVSGESGTEIIRVLPNSTDTSGTLSTLAGQLPSACGINLLSNLIEASDGNLYGLTSEGSTYGYGAFFKYVLSTRTCTPVYAFNPNVDGSYPATLSGGLIYGSDGNFYGEFGNGGPSAIQLGQVFQITPGGTYNQVYNFCATGASGCSDGEHPAQYLIEATDGKFYGVTNNGGSGANQGVFFQLIPGKTFPWVENTLFNISCANGCQEAGPIVEGPDGDLYGALGAGGADDGDGAIFQYDFQGDFIDFYDVSISYQAPKALFIGGDGNIYGQTQGYQCECPGDFFKITPGAGVYTDLSTYTASTLTSIAGPFIQASDGNFYGEGNGGGTKSAGGVWQAVPSSPIAAPIKVTLSASSTSGAPVTVSWKVNNATSNSFRNCYLYTNPSQGAGNFTGKAIGTQSGSVLSGSSSVSPTSTGTYTYAVTCGGVESGISPVLTVTGLAAAATKTVLKESATTTNIGSPLTFTATVTRTGTTGTPGGTVSFEFVGNILATETLNASGVASYTVSTTGLPPGNFPINAVYTPDATDTGSTSNSVSADLRYPTATTLQVTPNPATNGAGLTFTAHVTQTGSVPGTPTGTVNFLVDGAVLFANVALTNGVATATFPSTNGLPKGTYPATATYNTSASDNTSTSLPVNVTLN